MRQHGKCVQRVATDASCSYSSVWLLSCKEFKLQGHSACIDGW